MVEKRVIEVERPAPAVIERSGSGGAGWLIALVLVVALLVGAWTIAGWSGSTIRKNNAVAAAADNVSAAATKVGNAADHATGGNAPAN